MPTYVLVVDDDPDAREILMDIVIGLGLAARPAVDGEDAWEIIARETPAMILLDLMMPRMDGFGVLARIRANGPTRRIPVIVVSACARDQIELLRLPGVSAVVQKGVFSVDSLGDMIRASLEASSRGRLSAAYSGNTPADPSA